MKRRLMRDELLAVLERVQEDQKLGEELITIMQKIKNGEQLMTEEFLRVHDILWKQAPKAGFRNPENWVDMETRSNFD